jgi:5-methylcytosine-specific restriction endonuclease McrA
VDALLARDQKLITGTLNELEFLKNELNGIFIINSNDPGQRAFKELILEALHYSSRRSDFYPQYFRKLGIKSCVYCNSQLCITAEDENGIMVGKFQVDHHLPKDVYPGMSVWLANLVPSCGSCNNKKGNLEVAFQLYTSGVHTRKSPYSFEVVDPIKTVASYLASRDAKDIKIAFREPPAIPGKHQLNQLFAVKGIYDTQIDIVEDLILKAHIYDDTFKKELMDNFGDLFDNDTKNLNQLLVGTYIDEAKIHNRPLSKFIQDISRQLGLII